MRPHAKAKLGFFPLPIAEADRLRSCLTFPSQFSALDPCVGDGVAFTHLLRETCGHRYGIEIDANRAEQANSLGVGTLHADSMDVRCPPESGLTNLYSPRLWIGQIILKSYASRKEVSFRIKL